MVSGTNCTVVAAIAKYRGKETGETALLRQSLSCYSKGYITVADRFCGNYWTVALLMQAGVDVRFRKHRGRKTGYRRGKRLGKYEHIITWEKPKRPEWMSEEVYKSLPTKLELRELRDTVEEPGRRQQRFVIITTVIDVDTKDGARKEELIEFYGYRWDSEIDIRSTKTQLNLNHLRCNSPEMVRKESWVTILAYDRIRITSLGDAWTCGIRPRSVSFVSCRQQVLAAWAIIQTKTGPEHRQYCSSRLAQTGKCEEGQRTGRFEPRVRKRMPKQLQPDDKVETRVQIETGCWQQLT